MSKIQSFSYGFYKVNTRKIFSIDIHKTQKSKLIKSQWWNFQKKGLFPFLGHFYMTWELPHWNQKIVCLFLYFSDIYLHGKNQNDFYIFLIENIFLISSKNPEAWLARNIKDWFNIITWHYRLIKTSWEHCRNIIGW